MYAAAGVILLVFGFAWAIWKLGKSSGQHGQEQAEEEAAAQKDHAGWAVVANDKINEAAEAPEEGGTDPWEM